MCVCVCVCVLGGGGGGGGEKAGWLDNKVCNKGQGECVSLGRPS